MTGTLCKCDRRGNAELLCPQHCFSNGRKNSVSNLFGVFLGFVLLEGEGLFVLYWFIFLFVCFSVFVWLLRFSRGAAPAVKLESLCLGGWFCNRRRAESNGFLTL